MPAIVTNTIKSVVPYVLGATTFAAGVIVGASLVNLNAKK